MAACSDSNLQGDKNPASELNTFNLGGGHQLLMITLEQGTGKKYGYPTITKPKLKPEAETAHGGHLYRHRKGANGSNDNKPNAHTQAH